MKREDKLLIKYLQREMDQCYLKFNLNNKCFKYPGVKIENKKYFDEVYSLLVYLQRKKIKGE